MAISLPLGSGNTGTNDWSDVYNNDAQLVTEIDARDDNYQTILFASTGFIGDAAAATYILHSGTSPISAGSFDSGSDFGSGSGMGAPPMIYFDDADYTIASKTQKLRVRGQVNNNATAWSSVTATFGLYPVTFAGAADAITMTLGTVVSGSTAAVANPTASGTTQANSGDFTIPADGQYALGFITSAQLTNNSASLLTAQLQTRWV